MMDVIVNEGRQQVVGNTDGMKVTSEVEVDVLHGYHLSVSTASSSALDTKDRSERRLPQSDNGFFTDSSQSIDQSDRGSGLAFSCWCRRNSCHENQFAVWLVF